MLCEGWCKNCSSPPLSGLLQYWRESHNQDLKSFCRTTTLLTGQITGQLHFLTLPRPQFCVTKAVWFGFWDTLSPPCNFGPPLHCVRKEVCYWSLMGTFTWFSKRTWIELDLFSLTEWKPRGILMPTTNSLNWKTLERWKRIISTGTN